MTDDACISTPPPADCNTQDDADSTPPSLMTSNELIEGYRRFKELAQERLATIVKQEATIATLTEQLSSATVLCEKQATQIKELHVLCDQLSADHQLHQDIATKVNWLGESLYPLRVSELKIEGDLFQMTDREFEAVRGTVKVVACYRYALRRHELKKDDATLFAVVKGRPKVGNELKSFAKQLRIGEFLIKLTYALNKDFSGPQLLALLKSSSLPVSKFAELSGFPVWVGTKNSPSTVQGYVSQQFFGIPGVPFALSRILKEMKNSKPTPKPTPVPTSNPPKSSEPVQIDDDTEVSDSELYGTGLSQEEETPPPKKKRKVTRSSSNKKN